MRPARAPSVDPEGLSYSFWDSLPLAGQQRWCVLGVAAAVAVDVAELGGSARAGELARLARPVRVHAFTAPVPVG